MPLPIPISTGGGGGGTVDNATATNQSTTLSHAETWYSVYQGEVEIVQFAENTTQQSLDVGHFIRNFRLVFAAGWEGGNITITGTLRGAVQSETFTSPGIGGGTVVGANLFSTVNTNGVVNSAPGGNGAQSVEIQYGRKFGMAHAPLVAVPKVVQDQETITVTSSDLTAGWVEIGAAANGASVYTFEYRASHTHTQDAHDHDLS